MQNMVYSDTDKDCGPIGRVAGVFAAATKLGSRCKSYPSCMGENVKAWLRAEAGVGGVKQLRRAQSTDVSSNPAGPEPTHRPHARDTHLSGTRVAFPCGVAVDEFATNPVNHCVGY